MKNEQIDKQKWKWIKKNKESHKQMKKQKKPIENQ